MDYSDRTLSTVQVADLTRLVFEDGTTGLTGTVEIRFSAMDGSRYGPILRLVINVGTDENPNFQEAERAFLEAAVSLLSRAGRETVEALEAASVAHRKEPVALPD